MSPCIFTNNSSCWIYCDLFTFAASPTFLGSEKIWILSVCSLSKTTLRGHLVQDTGEDVGSGQEGLVHCSYSEGYGSATPSHFHCRSGCRTGGWGRGNQLGMFSITRMEAPHADSEFLARIKGQLHVTNHNYKRGWQVCSQDISSFVLQKQSRREGFVIYGGGNAGRGDWGGSGGAGQEGSPAGCSPRDGSCSAFLEEASGLADSGGQLRG